MRTVQLVGSAEGQHGPTLTEEISAATVELHAEFNNHERTTAVTYINDRIAV